MITARPGRKGALFLLCSGIIIVLLLTNWEIITATSDHVSSEEEALSNPLEQHQYHHQYHHQQSESDLQRQQQQLTSHDDDDTNNSDGDETTKSLFRPNAPEVDTDRPNAFGVHRVPEVDNKTKLALISHFISSENKAIFILNACIGFSESEEGQERSSSSAAAAAMTTTPIHSSPEICPFAVSFNGSRLEFRCRFKQTSSQSSSQEDVVVSGSIALREEDDVGPSSEGLCIGNYMVTCPLPEKPEKKKTTKGTTNIERAGGEGAATDANSEDNASNENVLNSSNDEAVVVVVTLEVRDNAGTPSLSSSASSFAARAASTKNGDDNGDNLLLKSWSNLAVKRLEDTWEQLNQNAATERKFDLISCTSWRAGINGVSEVLRWLSYHRLVGFDHFFIYEWAPLESDDDLLSSLRRTRTTTTRKPAAYNNERGERANDTHARLANGGKETEGQGSYGARQEEDESIEEARRVFYERVQPYIDKGYVTVIPWVMDIHGTRVCSCEESSYYDCIERNRQRTAWISNGHVDEFIYPKSFKDIKAALKTVPSTIDSARMYEYGYVFNGSDQKNGDGLRFTERAAMDDIDYTFRHLAKGNLLRPSVPHTRLGADDDGKTYADQQPFEGIIRPMRWKMLNADGGVALNNSQRRQGHHHSNETLGDEANYQFFDPDELYLVHFSEGWVNSDVAKRNDTLGFPFSGKALEHEVNWPRDPLELQKVEFSPDFEFAERFRSCILEVHKAGGDVDEKCRGGIYAQN